MPRSPFPRPWTKFSPHLKKSIFSSFCVTATTTQKTPKKPAKTNFFKMAQWIDSKLIANCFYDIRAYKLIFWGRTTNYYYDFFRVHFCAYPDFTFPVAFKVTQPLHFLVKNFLLRQFWDFLFRAC